MKNILLYLQLFCQVLLKLKESKISNLNVLLPISSKTNVSYRLQAYNGCYKWISSNPEVLSVNALQSQESCQNQVTIKVETNTPYHNMIWITAKDSDTGRVLSCEVRLATIKKLEILTKQKTVLVGDYETLELLGYDSKGNVFSTLEGLTFNWNIQQNQNYAEYQTFKEANKKTTLKRHQVEEAGQQSDVIILKGQQTGQIIVNSYINDILHNKASASQQLEIIEHFIVSPQNDLFLLPCDQIQFKLYLLHNNNQDIEINQVSLPNKDFQWQLKGENIGQLGNNGHLLVGEKEGIANVIIKDTRNIDNQISNTIRVVQPWRIKIFITEYNKEIQDFMNDYKNKILNPIEYYLSQFDNNWNLLKGRKYILKAFVLDKNENLVTIQNYRILFKYSTEYFYMHHQENDSVILETMSIGSSKLSAQMDSHNCLRTFKETHQIINIYSQVKIFKYINGPIYLPYLRDQNYNQMYQLQAIGGSGRYEWSVENSSIATINNHDQLFARQIGKTKVLVRDMMNQQNFDYQEIVVTKLEQQEFFEPKVEMLLDNQKDIFITAFDKQKHIYANCTDYQINIEPNINLDIENVYSYEQMMDQIQQYLNRYQLMLPQMINFDFIQPSTYSDYVQNNIISEDQLKKMYKFYQNFGICQSVKVKPLINNINSISFRSYDNRIKTLPVKIYKQSTVQYPEGFDSDVHGNQVIIAPGSSAKFFIKGGNESWLKDIPLSSRVLKKGEDFYTVEVGERIDQVLPVVVRCTTLNGQQQKIGKFSVITSNKNDTQLYSPLEVISNIEFTCAIPKSVRIIPQEKRNQNPKTYLQNIPHKIILKNDQNHEIFAQMFNSDHVPFYNATSIDQQWDLTSYSNGNLQKTSEQGKIVLELNDRIGDLVLKVKSQEGQGNLKFEPIQDEIMIESKKLLTIIPSYYVLYNHPENQMDFEIQNGSGDFVITVNNEHIVDYEFLPNQKIIRIKPKREGELVIKVLDNNLTFQNSTEAKVHIVSIDQIKINLPQKIVLKGEQVPVNFEVLGQGIKLPKEQLKYMDLKIATPSDELEVDNENFIINANKEGIYPVSIKSKKDNTTSNSIDFQVFDHIRAFPNKVNIVAGCVGYFQIQGGPNNTLRKQEGYEIQLDNPKNKINIKQVNEDLYEIHADKPLQDTIKITLISKKLHKEISTTMLYVSIGKIEDLSIRSSGVIHLGATTRLFVIPQIDYSNVSVSRCKLQYKLRNNSDGAFDVNGIANLDRQMTDLKLSILAVDIKGVKKGEGSLDIELSIQGQKTIKRQYYIQIEDSYMLPSSGFIADDQCLGSFLLLKPNSLYQLPKETSVYSQYQVIQHDGASELVNRNQIKTYSKIGNDFLVKKYSNQSQNELSLKVQNPHILVAEQSVHLTFMNNLTRTAVPLTYLDTFGRKFYKSVKPEKISVLVSNPEILNAFVDTQNQRLIIDTKVVGTTLIYIQDDNESYLFDIFQVSVGSLIAPEGQIKILKGSSIRFQNLQKDQNNLWKSTNPQILKIDTNGHAIALREGEAQVTFDEKLFLSQPIYIYDITSLRPIEQNPRLITNIKSHQDYQTHYQFYFQAYNKEGKLSLSQNDFIQLYKDIHCKVNQDTFSSQKLTDKIEQGLFGCQVTMREDKPGNIDSIDITIQIYTDQNQTPVATSTERVNVLQSFAMQKSGASDINLNRSNNKKQLTFNSAHPLDIEVMPNLKPYLVSKYDASKRIQGIQIVIPNTVKDSFESSFIVHSPQTHEKMLYKVHYNNRTSIFDGFLFNFKDFGIMDLLILLCCVVILYMIVQHKFTKKDKKKEVLLNQSTTNYSNGNINTFLNKTYTPVTLNEPIRRDVPNRSLLSNRY